MRIAAPSADSIGSLARSGLPWSSLRFFFQYLLRVISAAILARLLTPTDYGVFGMAAVVIAFMHTFADAGLGLATVQRKDLSETQVHNLFWFNFAAGLLLSLGCVLAAPHVSLFFRNEELLALLPVLGVGFLMTGVAVQPAALMRRQLQIRSLAIIELSSEVIGYATAVGMALTGFGFWALAGHSLASSGARTLLLLLNTGYRPKLPAPDLGTLNLIQFGGYLGAFSVVNYFARNLDNVLIGRVLGAEDLGFYTRAYFLMTLPTLIVTSPFSEVMLPSLSALQVDRARFSQAYRKAVAIVAFLAFPIAFGLIVTANGTVRLVFGQTWLSVVPLLQLLGVAAAVQPVVSTSGWLYGALGRGREMFFVGLVFSVVTVSSFVIGIRWGVAGVAGAYSVASLVLALPALWLAHRFAAMSFMATLREIAPFACAAVCMAVIVAAAGEFATNIGCGWRSILFMQVGLGVLVYGMVVLLISRDAVRDGIEAVRQILGKRNQ
jgi:PST family polysaccharide transporter